MAGRGRRFLVGCGIGCGTLLLLGVGGYGVIQQRAAMQEEIRSLQAALATAASPSETTINREAMHTLEQRNSELQATIGSLQLEIHSLQDTARGLESQLTAARSEKSKKSFIRDVFAGHDLGIARLSA